MVFHYHMALFKGCQPVTSPDASCQGPRLCMSRWKKVFLLHAHCETPQGKNPKLKNAHLSTCTRPNPSFKLAAWLPRPSRAPSQPARHDELKPTAPSLRLSGDSPDSRSGDATDWQVAFDAGSASAGLATAMQFPS